MSVYIILRNTIKNRNDTRNYVGVNDTRNYVGVNYTCNYIVINNKNQADLG